jgi:uncharacterized repeat protein (TIGR01451 family)
MGCEIAKGVRELKRSKIVIGLLVTLALILSLFGTLLPVYAADVVITKGVTPVTPNVYRLGDTIHYTMSIINVSNLTANEDLVIEEVRDVLPDGTIVYPAGPALPYTLAPGQSQTYTYDWVATRTGVVINTFYAAGYQITPQGNDDFEHQGQKSSLVIDPRIDVEKYVKDNTAIWQDADSATGPYIPSQTWVVFRFTIHNTGDVALTSVNLTDTDMSTFYTDEACTNPASFPTTLAVDETKTYYSRLAWAAGQHDDEATASGTPPLGAPVSDSDAAYYFGSGASIDVVKYVWDGATWDDADTAPGPSLTAAHDPVVFKFEIDNDGNVDLTGVNLTDTDISAFYTDQACTSPASFPTTLAMGQTKTYYGKLAWAQGQHTDTATATGTPPVGGPVSDSDPAHYFGSGPSIDVEKYVWDGATWDDADTAPGPSLTAAHDPVVFKFEIDNDGNVDLTGVNLTDTDISAFYTDQACTIPAVFPITTLTPSDPPVTVYGNLTWAQGQHTNTATVIGTPPVGPPVSDTDPANYFGPSPSIDVEKYVWDGATWHDADTPTGPSLTSAQNPVVFRFVITNNCGVNLTAVNLTDTDISVFYTDQACTIPAVFPITTLTPSNPPVTVYGNLTWAQGQHTNTATVTGTPPVGAPVSDSDPANYFGPPPSIDVEKNVWDGATWHDADTPTGPYLTSAQNPVVFRFVITNNCGVNLTNVTLSDTDMSTFYTDQACTTAAVFPIATLTPSDPPVTVYSKLTWAEGQHSNTATATGTPPVGGPVSDTDPAHYFGRNVTVGWETYPVNKVRVVLPWIGLFGAIVAGVSLFALRRRRLI